MEWIKQHVDIVIILSGILGAVTWMNGKFDIINHNFSTLEKEMAVIKTILVLNRDKTVTANPKKDNN